MPRADTLLVCRQLRRRPPRRASRRSRHRARSICRRCACSAADVVEIDVARRHRRSRDNRCGRTPRSRRSTARMMNSWLRSPPIGPVSATHRDRLQAQAREGAQIGDEHLVVGMPRAGLVEVEGIGVLHQEFAAAHDAEARPHLVAELPLDVIEVERQILVGPHIGAEDLGDHLLVGRAVEHVALVPVLDAQHLLAIVVVAPALAPQVGRLDRRHQHFDGAGAVLLLAHDLRRSCSAPASPSGSQA